MTIVDLSSTHREALIAIRDRSTHATERLRAVILLSRSRGFSQNETAEALHCARSTVQAIEYRYRREGLDGVTDRRRHKPRHPRRGEIIELLPTIVAKQPGDFGWNRSTWSIELVCREVEDQLAVAVSVSYMAELLHAARCRRLRPKPTVALAPDDKEEQLAALAEALDAVGPEDVVLYSDEVDIHLNPKVGPDWTPAGQRKSVVTPGKNKKNYLAGAYNPATGTLIAAEGESKNSDLFIKLVNDLARRYRLHGTIHLVIDNYIIHRSKKTLKAIAALGGKVVLHFLPPYCPDNNRIERVWLDLHTAVTRNHKHPTISELMAAVRVWLKHYTGQGARNANTALASRV